MQDGVAQELPAARTVAPPPTGIEYPAAGLVLVVVALVGLPQVLNMLTQVLLIHGDPEWKVFGVLLTMLLVTASELAAGIAIAWQLPSRRQWFAGFVCVSIATILVTFAWLPNELGARSVGVLAFELLGTPLLIVLGPRMFPLPNGPGLAGLLVVGGTSVLLTQVVHAFDQTRGLVHAGSIGSLLGGLLHVTIGVAGGVLALRAGRSLSRGEPARRAVGVYVIVAIASIVVLDGLSIVYWLVDDHAPSVWRYLLPGMATGALVGIARPLIVWWYAQRELSASATAPGSATLPWLALWFVPQLLGRLFLYEELAAFGDITRIGLLLGAATAIAIIVAARTGRLWWLPATLAGALFALGLYFAHTQPDRFGIVGTTIIGPLALMFAALATAAWFARRVPSP